MGSDPVIGFDAYLYSPLKQSFHLSIYNRFRNYSKLD